MSHKKLSSGYYEYINSPRWKQSLRRKLSLNLLFGRDIICPLLKAHDVEHLTYSNFKKELPIRDLVPLNRVVHRNIITPIKGLFRVIFGRKLGNFLMAWFLRTCLLFWYVCIVLLINTVVRELSHNVHELYPWLIPPSQ
jgi:hypothetical protein